MRYPCKGGSQWRCKPRVLQRLLPASVPSAGGPTRLRLSNAICRPQFSVIVVVSSGRPRNPRHRRRSRVSSSPRARVQLFRDFPVVRRRAIRKKRKKWFPALLASWRAVFFIAIFCYQKLLYKKRALASAFFVSRFYLTINYLFVNILIAPLQFHCVIRSKTACELRVFREGNQPERSHE